MLVLEVLDGNSNRSLFEFGMGQFVLGKGDHCDLILSDCHVSRSHATIAVNEGQVTIKDLESTNGTWINGHRIESESTIEEGDLVKFGDLSVVIMKFTSNARTLTFEPPLLQATTAIDNTETVAEPFVKESHPSLTSVAETPVPIISSTHKTESSIVTAASTAPKTIPKTKADLSTATVDAPVKPVEIKLPNPLGGTEFRLLQKKLFGRLNEKLRGTVPSLDRKNRLETVKRNISDEISEFKERFSAQFSEERLIDSLVDELWGFGPLDKLLSGADFEFIYIEGPSQITIEGAAGTFKHELVFLSEQSYMDTVARIRNCPPAPGSMVTPHSQEVSLPKQQVATIIESPHVVGMPRMVIRNLVPKVLRMSDLVDGGLLSEEAALFLKQAIGASKNIIISGRKNVGKTTLIKALEGCFDGAERIATIEQVPELNFKNPRCTRFIIHSVDGENRASATDLLDAAMMLNPDRLLLGDCTSDVIEPFLDAATSGPKSVITTATVEAPSRLIKRLEIMLLMADPTRAPESARQLVLNGLDIVVHLGKMPDGSRKVTQISEIACVNQNEVSLIDIFKLDPQNDPMPGKSSQLSATGYKPLSLKEFNLSD